MTRDDIKKRIEVLEAELAVLYAKLDGGTSSDRPLVSYFVNGFYKQGLVTSSVNFSGIDLTIRKKPLRPKLTLLDGGAQNDG
jgi:hypothetical protein